MNITKQYSMAVIAQAVNRVRFEGGREREIADYLEIDASNISKYKSGESTLSPTNMRLLIDRYGQPKRAPGRYLTAALYNSVDQYIADVEQRQMIAIKSHLGEYFSNQDVLQGIADSVNVEVIGQRQEVHCPPELKVKVLNWLDQQLKGDAYQKWYSGYLDFMSKIDLRAIGSYTLVEPKHRQLKQCSDVWRKTYISQFDNPLFHLLGYYYSIDNDFSVVNGTPTKIPTLPDNMHEIVLTGSPILTIDALDLDMSPRPVQLFSKTLSRALDAVVYPDKDINKPKDSELYLNAILSRSVLKSVTLELYLNEDLQYRAKLTESWGYGTRQAVIRHLSADNIIGLFQQLQAFLQVETSQENDLKIAIAEKGGFIPGAIVL